MPEVLIVFAEPLGRRMVTHLKTQYRVKALAPPRIVVVELQESELSDLQRTAGVETVLTGPSSRLPASLTEPERLFVTGWQQQQQGGKQHEGEGLPWDAEGYLPPDKPRLK